MTVSGKGYIPVAPPLKAPVSQRTKFLQLAEANGWTLLRSMGPGIEIEHADGTRLFIRQYQGTLGNGSVYNPGCGGADIALAEAERIIEGERCLCTETFSTGPDEGLVDPSPDCPFQHPLRRAEAEVAHAHLDDAAFLEKVRANAGQWVEHTEHYAGWLPQNTARRLGWSHRDCAFECRSVNGKFVVYGRTKEATNV